MYLIRSLCPRTDLDMGAHGFTIELSAGWRDLVSRCDLDQGKINGLISTCGRDWLDACGFNQIYDPDNYGLDRDPKKKPGPNAKPLYEPHTSLRVGWGAWGPEHITVPGNACGLDIERTSFGRIMADRGVTLLPHNIDSWKQKNLLLIVFTEIAESVVLFSQAAKVLTPDKSTQMARRVLIESGVTWTGKSVEVDIPAGWVLLKGQPQIGYRKLDMLALQDGIVQWLALLPADLEPARGLDGAIVLPHKVDANPCLIKPAASQP